MSSIHRLFLMAFLAMVLTIASGVTLVATTTSADESKPRPKVSVKIEDLSGSSTKEERRQAAQRLKAVVEKFLARNPNVTEQGVAEFVEEFVEDNPEVFEDFDGEFRVRVTIDLIFVQFEFELECGIHFITKIPFCVVL